MIKCSECGHENEKQRIYCHNCGAKLDRTEVIIQAEKPKPIPRKPFSQTVRNTYHPFAPIFSAAFFALLVASLIQSVRPPSGAPVVKPGEIQELVDAPSITIDLEDAAISPRRIGYTEQQLNAYLKNRVKPAKDPFIPAWVSSFELAYVNLYDASFRITKKYQVFSYPLYIGATYTPQSSQSTQLKNIGGNLGSFPIAGPLYDLVDQFIFRDFVVNMKDEAKGLAKMRSLQITPKGVIINSAANAGN